MGIERSILLAEWINEAVAPHGFRRLDKVLTGTSLDWVGAWKRKTWNTNRGIALLRLPPDAQHAGEYALDIRKAVGKPIGYIPFLYELGLQLVLCGEGVRQKATNLDRYVTPVNNSTVLLQSLHLVDLNTGESVSSRTWGQVITGKWIDAIESGISTFRSGEGK